MAYLRRLCKNRKRCIIVIQGTIVVCLAVALIVLIRASGDRYLTDQQIFLAINALSVAAGLVLLLIVRRSRDARNQGQPQGKTR
jgi:general stress protein CsbA